MIGRRANLDPTQWATLPHARYTRKDCWQSQDNSNEPLKLVTSRAGSYVSTEYLGIRSEPRISSVLTCLVAANGRNIACWRESPKGAKGLQL